MGKHFKIVGKALVTILSIVAVTGIVAIAMPGFHSDTQQRERCRKMWLIWVALAHYSENNEGQRLLLSTESSDGKPLVSWRCCLVSYLESNEAGLCCTTDGTWTSEAFKELRSKTPPCYSAEAGKKFKHAGGETDYLAVAGEGTWWGMAQTTEEKRVNDKNASGDTIILVEKSDTGVNWIEPRDFDIDQLSDADLNKLSGEYFKGPDGETFAVLFLDGSVWILDADTPLAVLSKFFKSSPKGTDDRRGVLKKYLVYERLVK